MKDEERLENIQLWLGLLSVVLMIVNLFFQVFSYQFTLHIILCVGILISIVILLRLDHLLHDRKSMMTHGVWGVFWIVTLIVSIVKIVG